MNYYAFHIGDYLSDTAHLELFEDLAYRRLLDLYYLTEDVLPDDFDWIVKKIRMRGQEEAVRSVLKEFFTYQAGAGYLHARCERLVREAQEKSGKAKESAAKRWDKDRNANGMPSHGEGSAPNPKTNPIPKTKQPPTPKGGEPVGFAEFYEAYPRKEARPKAAKAFAKVTAALPTLLAAIDRQRRTEGWTKDKGKYIPLPATWLNDERWNDETMGGGEDTEWHQSKSGVEAKARELMLAPWNEMEEQWPFFRQRVMKAERANKSDGFSLDQLARMARERGGAQA